MVKGIKPIAAGQADRLRFRVYDNRQSMGAAACQAVAEKMKELLSSSGERIRMVFAAAPSQNEFLAALSKEDGIDWARVTAFHMDEYIGLPDNAPQRFGKFLSDRLFDAVKPGEVQLIGSLIGTKEECERYAALLKVAPIDIVCLGIGENGHIAFNDPPVADFSDPETVKLVELEEACRRQQVHDGCFTSLEDVPTHALTLTIPALMSGAHLFCMVPGPTKRNAVRETLEGSVSTACPATVLRGHPDCILFVDSDSYGD